MKITAETSGLAEVFDALDRQASAPEVNAGVQVSGSEPEGVSTAVVARAQVKAGRDPFYLQASEDAAGDTIVSQIVDAWLAGAATSVMALTMRLAQLFAMSVKRHIAEGSSSDGSMKALTKRYEYIKKQKYGSGKPILVRTGALLASIRDVIDVRVNRRRA